MVKVLDVKNYKPIRAKPSFLKRHNSPEFSSISSEQKDYTFKLLAEHRIRSGGDSGYRVARDKPSGARLEEDSPGKGKDWYHISEYSTARNLKYHYRSLMKGQVVFDIGDHLTWRETVEDTMELWGFLHDRGVPFWGSLSGGKGTHTEFFIGPNSESEYSGSDANLLTKGMAVHAAMRRTSTPRQKLRGRVDYDPVLIDANTNSKLIREFGCAKGFGGVRRKSLWTDGSSKPSRLPYNKTEAYRVVEGLGMPKYPTSIPIYNDYESDFWMLAESSREALPGRCPTGPGCYSEENWYGTCVDCPRLR